MSTRTKHEKWRAFAGLFSGRGLGGERILGSTDRAELLVGLAIDQLKPLVGQVRARGDERCEVGYKLTSRAKRTDRITPSEVLRTIAFIRSGQRRSGARGPEIGIKAFSASAIRMIGHYKGEEENSVRVLILNAGTETSTAAFRYNIKRLAQELGCALAQEAVITSIDRTPEGTYDHSPTGFPDPPGDEEETRAERWRRWWRGLGRRRES